MAEDSAIGFSIEIPDSVFAKLDSVDNKLKQIQDTAKETSDKIKGYFNDMAKGIDPMLSKIKEANNVLGSLSTSSLSSGMRNTQEYIKGASSEAEKMTSAFVRATDAINRLGEGKNIASLKNDIKEITNALEKGRGADSILEQQQLVDARAMLKEELSIQSESTKQKEKQIQKESDLEEKRYLKWLENKDKEVTKQEETELKKYNSIKQSIAKQNAEYEKQQQKLQELYNRQNELAKNSATNKGFNETVKVWEEGFRRYEEAQNAIIAKKKEEAKVINDATKANIEAYKNEQNQLRKNISETEKMYAQLFDQIQQSENKKRQSTYSGALAMEDNTINQRIAKIQALQKVRDNLSKTDSDYEKKLKTLNEAIRKNVEENNKATESTRRLSESHSKVLNTADQLTRKIALLFSVAQIQGYLNNLVRVRGEFELQNAALASLLQNKDKADQLFAQITELAVKSPFTVKELVTYTKNLAAYQVEEEKLYDTTKRLADISAGLGVSMDRLILAYGQVKASNFLRGTEVRQFTEAGFNILGELADYYGELENRMVSVSEVQEMVTKRMVSFGDVEEVFNRVTSAGGLFYQMQEKQAETLAGQMSNLQDSIDIMFNKIGQENEGTIKDIVSSVREMVEGYKDIQFALESMLKVLSPVLAYMGLAKVASLGFTKQIIELSKNSKALNVALSSMDKALDSFAKRGTIAAKSVGVLRTAMAGIVGLGVGAVLVGITSGLTYLYVEATKASRQAEELSKSLGKIRDEGNYNASKLSTNFEKLAETILTTSKNSKEYNDALSELKRTYGDILPEQTLTIEGLKDLKGNYDSVTQAIYSNIEARMKEKEITAITEIYGENVEKSAEDFRKMLIKEFEILPEDASRIVTKFREAVESGTLNATSDFGAFVNSAIKDVTGLEKNVRDTYTTLIGSSFFGDNKFKLVDVSTQREEVKDFFNDVIILKEKIDDAYNTSLGSSSDSDFRALDKNIEEVEKRISEAKKRIAEEGEGDSFIISEAQLDAEKRMLQEWITSFKDGSVEIKNAYGKIIDPDSQVALKFIDDVQKKINSLNGDKAQQEIKNIVVQFSNLNKIKLGGFEDVFKESTETMSDYRKRITSMIEDIEERLKQYSYGWSGYITQIFTDDDANRLKDKLSILKEIEKSEFADIPTQKETKDANKIWEDRISLIKQAGQEYEKFIKYYSEEDSADKVRANFESAFNNLQIGDVLATMTFDTSGVISALEDIGEKGGTEISKKVDEEVSKLKTDVDIDVKVKNVSEIKKQVDNLFSGYDFFKELRDLDLSKEIGSQIFNIAALDLDDLQVALAKYKESLGSLGTEQVKIFEEAEKKVTELQNREREERLKKYVQYLNKSVSKRVSIELEAQKEIAKIQSDQYLTSDQKSTIVSNMRKDLEKQLNSLSWDQFKGNDMYISMFEDLERTSTAAIEVMLDKLRQLRNSLGDLSPTELKDITSQIQKLQDELESRNPFRDLIPNIREYISYLKEKNNLEKAYTDSVERESDLETRIEIGSKEVASLQQQYDLSVKKYGVESRQADIAETRLLVAKKNLTAANDEYEAQKKTTKEIIDQIKEGETLRDVLAGAFSVAGSYASDLSGTISSVASSLENVFGTMSDKPSDTINTTTEVLNGLSDIGSGVSSIMSGNIVSGTLQTIRGLASTIGSLSNIGDKKKEREIQRQIELVDNLDKSYQKLAESIENAYSFDSLTQSNEAAQQNLQQQIDAYERMIALEEDKKKTDSDKIKEWQDAISDLQEQQQQLEQNMVTAVGGIGDESDIKSAAEDFVDAWLTAYTEVGDGLSGLQDNFDEFIQNAAKKQLLTQLSDQFITPILESFNKMFGADSLGGEKLTGEELDAFRKLYEEYSEIFDERAKAYLEALGIEPGTDGTTEELSGLSKGIQSITEETAQALEALLNSMRFFVADSNTQLKSIYASLTSQDALQNPILAEMKAQTALIQSINNLFGSVIKSGHPKYGGSFIKVSM